MRREYLVGVGFIGVAVVVFLVVLFYNPDPQQSTLPLHNDRPGDGKLIADARTAGDVPEPKLTSMNPPTRTGDTGAGASPVLEPRVEPSNLPATEPTPPGAAPGAEQPIGSTLTHNPDSGATGSGVGAGVGADGSLPPAPRTGLEPAPSPEPARPEPARPEPTTPEVRTGGEELRPNRGGVVPPPTVTPGGTPAGNANPRGSSDPATPPRSSELPRRDAPTTGGKAVAHKIQKNDTLVSLAQKYYGDGDQWRRIQSANKGLSPKRLYVGKTILIPPLETAAADAPRTEPAARPAGPVPADPNRSPGRPEARGTYTVADNDTLVKIARSQLGDGERWREIYELNRDKLSNPNRVTKGMVLRMPAKTTATADASRGNP